MKYRVQENDEEIALKFIMEDQSVVETKVAPVDTFADIKEKVFEKEFARVVFLIAGSEVDEAGLPQEYLNGSSVLQIEVKFANAEVSFLQEASTPINQEVQSLTRGNLLDLLLFFVLGVVLNVMLVIYVSAKQLLIGKVNQMRILGGILGIITFLWFMLQFKVLH